MSVVIKSMDEVAAMREAGRLNAEVRAILREAIGPGVTGRELDALAKDEIARRHAEPTFVGYAPGDHPPYPGAICFSVNEQLVHGIPGERALKEGDIVSIDLGMTYQGWVADAAFTVGVGDIAPEVRQLLEVTEAALERGIEAARGGAHLGDISFAIGEPLPPPFDTKDFTSFMPVAAFIDPETGQPPPDLVDYLGLVPVEVIKLEEFSDLNIA